MGYLHQICVVCFVVRSKVASSVHALACQVVVWDLIWCMQIGWTPRLFGWLDSDWMSGMFRPCPGSVVGLATAEVALATWCVTMFLHKAHCHIA